MSSYLPPFVTEWGDHIVADCVPASGLMLANKVDRGGHPSGAAEREALQDAMGTQDTGADGAQLAAGLVARYGLRMGVGYSWANIAAALSDPGFGVVLFGTYQSLPGDIRAMGGQPGYTGGHAMYAQANGAGSVTLGDPLGAGYLEHVPIASLRAFCAGLGFMHLAALERVYQAGWRAYVGPGHVTFWHVLRFTHALYAGRPTDWQRVSTAPVAHGSPGFWSVSAGYYAGLYLVAGRSGPFRVRAIMSDGSSRDVDEAR